MEFVLFIELIITLITMPIFIKRRDWGWFACVMYIMLCMMFTPFVGIAVYKFSGG